MTLTFGWHLPESDRHFTEYLSHAPHWRGRALYQSQAIQAALAACASFRRAIDVGAHVGFWSWILAQHFRHVESFEPVAAFREMFTLNVDNKNVHLHGYAIGKHVGKVTMVVETGNSGMSHILPNDRGGDVMIRPLDHFKLKNVDLIKIDVEGFETAVIEGAHDTLLRWRPIVVIEQKAGATRFGYQQTQALDHLTALGAVLLRRINDDYVLGWKK